MDYFCDNVELQKSLYSGISELENLRGDFVQSGDREISRLFFDKINAVRDIKEEFLHVVAGDGRLVEVVRYEQEMLKVFSRVVGSIDTEQFGNSYRLGIFRCINNESEYMQHVFNFLYGFHDLQVVDFSKSNISTLPNRFPPVLSELYIDHTDISEIDSPFPHSLRVFSASHTKISEIPESLPDSLRVLNIRDTKVSVLTDSLPDGLAQIDIRDTPAAKNEEVRGTLMEFGKRHPLCRVFID